MTARQVIRRREKRPQVVLAHVMSRYYALQEQRLRAAKATTQAQPQTQVDFLVPLTAPIIGGLAFSVTQAGEAAWYATEGIEQATLRIVDLLLPEGGRFVDCGANVGVFSVAAALKAGCNGTVVAFEPSPRAGAALATNLQRHGVADRVEVRQEAAGRKGEQKVFRQYENSLVSGFGEAPATSVPGEIVEESVVHVATLADLVRPPVDLLKIDVEGYEPEVLEGARTLISESPEIALLVEFNPAVLAAAGYSPADIFVHFPQDEWHLWIVDDQTLDADDPIRPIDLKSWTAGPIADAHWYGNLLAVRRDRATGMPGVHAGE